MDSSSFIANKPAAVYYKLETTEDRHLNTVTRFAYKLLDYSVLQKQINQIKSKKITTRFCWTELINLITIKTNGTIRKTLEDIRTGLLDSKSKLLSPLEFATE